MNGSWNGLLASLSYPANPTPATPKPKNRNNNQEYLEVRTDVPSKKVSQPRKSPLASWVSGTRTETLSPRSGQDVKIPTTPDTYFTLSPPPRDNEFRTYPDHNGFRHDNEENTLSCTCSSARLFAFQRPRPLL